MSSSDCGHKWYEGNVGDYAVEFIDYGNDVDK